MVKLISSEFRIAIVGAGPSGCFLAGALKRSLPDARVVVIDRMPTPFGLVRYGVAADHQGTKAITRQFDRIFNREGVEFAGNVRVTDDDEPGAITLSELRRRSDVVVLATGLAADRGLNIPGATLPGVIGSGVVTRLLNSHPDEIADVQFMQQLGERIAIVGLGNVAIDLIRFLAKQAEDFAGSDVNDSALGVYHSAPASSVEVFSRSALAHVKCDAPMINELAQIEGLRVTIDGAIDAAGASDRKQDSRVNAIRNLVEATEAIKDPRIVVKLHFGTQPLEVLGDESVTSLRVRELDNQTTDYLVTSVITAIGFEADQHSLFCAGAPLVGSEEPSGRIQPGLYRVGWFRRGPRGTIPDNRSDAVHVATEIISDIDDGAIGSAVGWSVPLLPAAVANEAISYSQWLKIDRCERERAAPSRVRKKLPTVAQMVEMSRQEDTRKIHESATSETQLEMRKI